MRWTLFASGAEATIIASAGGRILIAALGRHQENGGSVMTACIVAHLSITNPELFTAYREQVAPIVSKFGGRYVVRGGAAEALEGVWGIERLVVIEFPTREQALAFYNGDDYAPIRRLRQAAARGTCALVEGAHMIAQ